MMSDEDVICLSSSEDETPSSTTKTASEKPPLATAPKAGSSRSSNLQENGSYCGDKAKKLTKNQEALKILIDGITTLKAGNAHLEKVVEKINNVFEGCTTDFKNSKLCFNLLTRWHLAIQGEPKSVFVKVLEFKKVLSGYKDWKKSVNTAHAPRNVKKPSSSRENQETVDTVASDPPGTDETQKKNRKIEKQLAKLSETLEECNTKIKQLDETEVDWDDDINSAFMQKRTFEHRATRIWQKIVELEAKLEGTAPQPLVERHPKICTMGVEGLQHKLVNDAIDKFVNKQLKVGEICFPNFYEVKQIVSRVNREESLGMSNDEVFQYASRALKVVGSKIKKTRELAFQRNILALVETEDDPADADPELQRKLEQNREVAERRVKEVLDTYAARSMKEEKEEALGSDEEISHDLEEAEEPGDEEDYETISEHGDEAQGCDAEEQETIGDEQQTNKEEEQTNGDELLTNEEEQHTNGRAVLEEATAEESVQEQHQNRKRRHSDIEKIKADIETWSDIDGELLNDTEEEREMPSSPDELALVEKVANGPPACPKDNPENPQNIDPRGESSLNQSSGSFNPVIVDVSTGVSGFSQEAVQTGGANPFPSSSSEPLLATDALNMESMPTETSSPCQKTNVKRQRARKSFPRPPEEPPEDLITLD